MNLRTWTVGWAQWNLSRFEFKFDDARLSSWYKNKIGPIELTLLSLCPVGCLSLAFQNWDSQQGRDLATSGCNRQKFQLGQSYSYLNNLGFMVLILSPKYQILVVWLFFGNDIFPSFEVAGLKCNTLHKMTEQ